jgi:hypothetical protein
LLDLLGRHNSRVCYKGAMTVEILSDLDLSRWEQPEPTTDLRQSLEGWLRYQRHEFLRKLRDLTPEGLVAWSVPPLELSVLGLVRHMTQMEHVFLAWGLGGGERVMVYGEDDYAGGSVETVDEDLGRYVAEVEKADRARRRPVTRLPGPGSWATPRGDPDQDDRRVRPPQRASAHASFRRPR